jgi:ATP-dependent protease Clp ATPase subunit
MTKKQHCSFCDQSEDETKYTLAGPGVSICNECVEGLMEIIAQRDEEWRDSQIERLTQLRNGAAPQSK